MWGGIFHPLSVCTWPKPYNAKLNSTGRDGGWGGGGGRQRVSLVFSQFIILLYLKTKIYAIVLLFVGFHGYCEKTKFSSLKGLGLGLGLGLVTDPLSARITLYVLSYTQPSSHMLASGA